MSGEDAIIKRRGDYYIEMATAYARQARRRTTTHCAFIRHICSEFIERLSRPPEGYELWDNAVLRVCNTIESLPHVKGRQFRGHIELMPWQAFNLVQVFGWVKTGTDIRKHNIAFAQVAKKNGKSTLTAPIGIYMMSPREGERGAEVYCAASKRDQARIVLDIARAMLENSPEFLYTENMSVWKNHIECLSEGVISVMKSLSSDAPQTDDGINPSCVLCDEVHSMRDSELRGTLIKGVVARDNGLMYQISTAGKTRDDSPCLEENRKARKWVRGEIDLPHYYAMIFEQDDVTAEIKKPKTWAKSNPSVGVTMTADKLEMILADAEGSPLLRNQFIQKHLNAFTSDSDTWLDMDAWARAQREPADKPDGLKLYMGVDMSSVVDLTAVGLCWVDDSDPDAAEYWIAADCFCTALSASRHGLIKRYVELGHITEAGKEIIDQSWVHDHILDRAENEILMEIGYDKWSAATLANNLSQRFDLVEVRQGAQTFSEPMKNFEALLLSGRIHVIGDPSLTWQAGNLLVQRDRNDNWAPIKKTQGNKVDGPVAILIAFVRAWRHTSEPELTADDVISA